MLNGNRIIVGAVTAALLGFFAYTGSNVFLDDRVDPYVPEAPSPAQNGARPHSGDAGLKILTPAAPPVPEPIAEVDIEDEDPFCFVGIYDGYLALFPDQGDTVPTSVTDIPITHIARGDVHLFEERMAVYSDAQLTSILEDFGS